MEPCTLNSLFFNALVNSYLFFVLFFKTIRTLADLWSSLKGFKMLENLKKKKKCYLFGNCSCVLLLQNKSCRLLKTTSCLSLDVRTHTGSVLVPQVPPCSPTSWSSLPHLYLDLYWETGLSCGLQHPITKTLPDTAISCCFSTPAGLSGSPSLFLLPLHFLI